MNSPPNLVNHEVHEEHEEEKEEEKKTSCISGLCGETFFSLI
jgi:hypothetical protein